MWNVHFIFGEDGEAARGECTLIVGEDGKLGYIWRVHFIFGEDGKAVCEVCNLWFGRMVRLRVESALYNWREW